MQVYRGRRCTAPLITRHGAFTRGKEPLCPLNGRPSEPQSWSGRSEDEEISNAALTEFRTQDCPDHSLVGIPTALSRVTHVRSVCSLVWQHAHTRVGQWTKAYRKGPIWQGRWHLCLHQSLSKTALRLQVAVQEYIGRMVILNIHRYFVPVWMGWNSNAASLGRA
jgi:hypothetical protein